MLSQIKKGGVKILLKSMSEMILLLKINRSGMIDLHNSHSKALKE
jgi:hypothetical protein